MRLGNPPQPALRVSFNVDVCSKECTFLLGKGLSAGEMQGCLDYMAVRDVAKANLGL